MDQNRGAQAQPNQQFLQQDQQNQILKNQPQKNQPQPQSKKYLKIALFLFFGVIIVIFTIYGILKLNQYLANQATNDVAKKEEEPKETTKYESDTTKWSSFENKEYGFRFKHPDLDSTCCDISGPLSQTARRLHILSDKVSVQNGSKHEKFNGIGVYIEPNFDNEEIREYVDSEIVALKKEYKLLTGSEWHAADTLEETTAGITSQYSGYKIYGFGQDNFERYYIDVPDQPYFLVLSKNSIGSKVFDEMFDRLLTTIEFFKPAVVACNNSGLSFTSRIPEDWTCVTDLGDGSRDAIIQTTITSELFEIKVTTDPEYNVDACGTERKPVKGCFYTVFYTNPEFNLDLFKQDGVNTKIYTSLKKLDYKRSIVLHITYKGVEERDLTPEEKMQLFTFLDSIEI